MKNDIHTHLKTIENNNMKETIQDHRRKKKQHLKYKQMLMIQQKWKIL